ncbi:MAG: nitrile hydratase subunit beta [Rhodospirillaceae bacterium]|nr:nitrile hydratase subunit beta [Rhodospirillaceae bacterium]
MNGGHDLGGMHGLGVIDAEPEEIEPVFHAEWERRMLALSLASAAHGRWNIDVSRHARERQHPADYLRNSYYENWLVGLETLLVESGLISANELATGKAEASPAPTLRATGPADMAAGLRKGHPVDVPPTEPPAFEIGSVVQVRNFNPTGHTRAPRYTRGRQGTIAGLHGCHIFPDTHSVEVEEAHHLYSVRFSAEELWGSGASGSAVFVDLWEPYLEGL